MFNYDNRTFRGRNNSANSEVSDATVFHYFQQDNELSGTYNGGSIASGHLLGLVHADDSLPFHYHHLNTDGELMAGKCGSEPVAQPDGHLVMHERWQWRSGDRSSGSSELEELDQP